jgi:CheY-like chemotaxis protein
MCDTLCCFFPTTVVLVDDSLSFIESLRELLETQNVICEAFTDAHKALNYINDVSKTNKLDYSDLIIDGEEGTSDWKSILLNISGLHREIYSSDRFSKISVVVSDYLMSGLDGVKLCSRVIDKNIQRVLLTGVADDRDGIDAFNNGYINRFVKKGANNFNTDIVDNVMRSINQYFGVYTDYLMKHVSIVDGTHLSDPIFANFFHKVFSAGDFVEYYMLDMFGSYLFVKSNGDVRMLSVLTENEIGRIIAVGMESEEIDEDVRQKLESRKYILAYHSRTGTLPPITEWRNYLRPAERLDGYQTYYFSLLGSELLDIDIHDIESFDSFKKSRKIEPLLSE